MSEDGFVTYTVKELLATLSGKMDDVIARIELKASQESVDHVNDRLDRLEEDVDARVSNVEKDVNSLKAYRAAVAGVLSVVVFVVPVITAFAIRYIG